LLDQPGGLPWRQWPALDLGGQAAALDEAHREVVVPSVFAYFIDRHDARIGLLHALADRWAQAAAAFGRAVAGQPGDLALG
jgi:hypothetical protein